MVGAKYKSNCSIDSGGLDNAGLYNNAGKGRQEQNKYNIQKMENVKKGLN